MSLFSVRSSLWHPQTTAYAICLMFGLGIASLGIYASSTHVPAKDHQYSSQAASNILSPPDVGLSKIPEKIQISKEQLVQQSVAATSSAERSTSASKENNQQPNTVQPGLQAASMSPQLLSPCMGLNKDLQDFAAKEYSGYLEKKARINSSKSRTKSSDIGKAYKDYKTALSNKYKVFKSQGALLMCKTMDASPAPKSK